MARRSLRNPRRRTPQRAAALLATLAALMLLPSCTRIDDALAAIPLFSFMRDSPAFDPYQAPRPAPANAVPYESPAGDVAAPIGTGEAALRAFAAEHDNTVAADEASLLRGQEMYVRYCVVCHGPAGVGGPTGPVTVTGAFPPITPNLLTERAEGLPDGYIYGIIRVGRGLMPSYERVPHLDRWHIVNYIRQLQASAAEPGS